MPRTKTAQNKIDARINTEEKVIAPKIHSTKSNYEYIQSLEPEELCKCFEYIFLLREINGMYGFLRDIKGFREKLPECWNEIRKSKMAYLFHGKSEGFMKKWFNQRIMNKITKLTVYQMAQFLTYFDRSASYRGEILKGDRHQILAYTEDRIILEWLNEV